MNDISNVKVHLKTRSGNIKKCFLKLIQMAKTLCLQETPKWVLRQTVKTQMKCGIVWHNATFHRGLHLLRRS